MKITADKITKKYQRISKSSNYFYALQETDFELESGVFAEIYGRSGSGKSTFLNILSGILTPSEGKILIDGKDLYLMQDSELSKFRNKCFGVIPQGQSGLNSLTVLENVKLPALIYGADSEQLTQKALKLLEQVGIAQLCNEKPQSLSGGEMRRMAIARALINEPAFVFADEPTSDLDNENTHNVLSILRDITKNGTGILLVTHETDADKYADKLYKMDAGRLSSV